MTADQPRARRIELEIEVPAGPEEVWEAIATGPGISAWFVPAEVEPGVGGTITQDHGDDVTAPPSRITAWEPPHRLALDDGEWQPTPTAPKGRIATEYLIEARSGGTCVVRLVESGFGSGDDWDRVVDGNAEGWRTVLETLRLYLMHFRGEPLGHAMAHGATDAPRAQAAAALLEAFGVVGLRPGDAFATPPGAPELRGVVEAVVGTQVIARIAAPARGLAFVAAGGPGDETLTFVRLKLFGDDAAALAAALQPRWQAWMDEHLARGGVAEGVSAETPWRAGA